MEQVLLMNEEQAAKVRSVLGDDFAAADYVLIRRDLLDDGNWPTIPVYQKYDGGGSTVSHVVVRLRHPVTLSSKLDPEEVHEMMRAFAVSMQEAAEWIQAELPALVDKGLGTAEDVFSKLLRRGLID